MIVTTKEQFQFDFVLLSEKINSDDVCRAVNILKTNELHT